VLAGSVIVAKNVNLVNIEPLHLMILRPVPHAVLDGTNRTLDKQAVVCAHQESINILKEKKHVWIVKLDGQRTFQATIKMNVCCVPLVKNLHELAALNVKIVVLEDTVLAAKNAN
jgi:hypothetical protein